LRKNHPHKNVLTTVLNDVFLCHGKKKLKKIFFLNLFFRDLKPIIVEPWDMKDEDDGLPEKSLIRNDAYFK
jgi:hypothetical protein